LAGLLVHISRSSKKRERAEQQFAQSQGWVYTQSYNDPQGLTEALQAKLEKMCPEKKFRLNNSIMVESGRCTVILKTLPGRGTSSASPSRLSSLSTRPSPPSIARST
jgi:hypothetical protein